MEPIPWVASPTKQAAMDIYSWAGFLLFLSSTAPLLVNRRHTVRYRVVSLSLIALRVYGGFACSVRWSIERLGCMCTQ
eukprot:2396468-Amphidinium_carterae.1